jgi:hypothetical protein
MNWMLQQLARHEGQLELAYWNWLIGIATWSPPTHFMVNFHVELPCHGCNSTEGPPEGPVWCSSKLGQARSGRELCWGLKAYLSGHLLNGEINHL